MLPRSAGARVGDGRPRVRRRRRHPRQDHDHLAAHRRAAGRRRRPVVRHRRRPRATGTNAADGRRRPVRGRGRRERRRVPGLPAARRRRHQRRGRPPRPVGHRGGLPRRRSPSSSAGSSPTASWSAASTTPARPRSSTSRATAGWRRTPWARPTSADVRCVDLAFAGETSAFTVVDGGAELGRVTLRIPGRHYVLDALAALAVGLRLGYAFDDLRRGLEGFTGTRRRMERKGEAGGVRVYDSYAHHPAEIAGDLQAARAVAGDGRVVVVFQPHLVSRTRLLRRGDGGGARRRRRGRGRSTSTSPARRPTPPSPARWWPTPYRCRAERVALRARPRRRLPRTRSRGPGPATWCSPSAPGTVTELGPASDLLERRAGRPHAESARPTRKRFARRQWARRWLTWRYVLAVAGRGRRWSVGGVYAGLLLQHPVRQGVEVSGTQTLSERRSARWPAVPTGGPLATVDLDDDRLPGAVAWPW